MGKVAAEIKQTRPFRSQADEAVVTLLRTADQLRTTLSAVVEPRGITLQQYNVLRILRGAGEAGLPTLEIAARMIEHSPGITRLLDRLESKGWVVRVRCPDDRRQVLCHGTEAARALLDALDAPVEKAGESFLGALDRKQTSSLVVLLDALRPPRTAAAACPSETRKNPKKKEKEKETRS